MDGVKSSAKVGDIVQLKPGGPKMVIESVEPDGRVVCVWMHHGCKYADVFRVETLVGDFAW